MSINPFTQFTGLPDLKENTNFTIIFMEEHMPSFAKLTFMAPADKKVKDLMEFLRKTKANPFRNFFITNKLKEKPQFTLQKNLREVKNECSKDQEGNYVLLCYEEKKSIAEVAITQKSVPQAPASETKKEKEDDSCLLM